MSVFDNLGLCHNSEGIAQGFAVPVSAQLHGANIKNAPDLSALELLIMAMIAKQLYES